jgi:hypothetical protein
VLGQEAVHYRDSQIHSLWLKVKPIVDLHQPVHQACSSVGINFGLVRHVVPWLTYMLI